MGAAQFNVVIPARFASSRLPAKPLADIGGRPMIQWVYEAACRSGAAEVVIATDDSRIASACAEFGCEARMTASELASGTDRIASVAEALGWPDEQIVVNVQGDEPLLPPALVLQVARLLSTDAQAALSTLTTPILSADEFHDPNVVKVVVDAANRALYFSRASIPWPRDGAAARTPRRHIGLYAYRVGQLKRLAAAEPCDLESTERLEQLRALWLGYRIAVADAEEVPPRGVDTPEDLEAVRRIVASRG